MLGRAVDTDTEKEKKKKEDWEKLENKDITPWISVFNLKQSLETGFPDSEFISTSSSSCLGVLILFTF